MLHPITLLDFNINLQSNSTILPVTIYQHNIVTWCYIPPLGKWHRPTVLPVSGRSFTTWDSYHQVTRPVAYSANNSQSQRFYSYDRTSQHKIPQNSDAPHTQSLAETTSPKKKNKKDSIRMLARAHARLSTSASLSLRSFSISAGRMTSMTPIEDTIREKVRYTSSTSLC